MESDNKDEEIEDIQQLLLYGNILHPEVPEFQSFQHIVLVRHIENAQTSR
ncbi:hypothetical protein HOY82DRAFT_598349 [Tuber indicum]|nr:hypothetical protein HOY82DRAFT_598349 [Tuber indicum]